MSTTAFQGTPVHTVGELPAVGSQAPDFELVGKDLSTITLKSLRGRRVVLNIFPSLDTGVCATSVLAVSKDLPFAAERFCVAEGIENVVPASAFRKHSFSNYGVLMTDGPLAGLLARSVVVIDENGTVVYNQLVPEIGNEPDYDDAVAALK